MLSFLWVAAGEGYVVESYEDCASGQMGKYDEGRIAVTNVELRPRSVFAGEQQPDHQQLLSMHHEAHKICFISNSVRTEIVCTPITDD
mgnify:CR=1 FL=1